MKPPPLMPSYEVACDVWRGDPQAFWKVGLGVVSRAAIIGAGMFAGGSRRNVARNAVYGSVAVELFVLGWVWWNSRRLR